MVFWIARDFIFCKNASFFSGVKFLKGLSAEKMELSLFLMCYRIQVRVKAKNSDSLSSHDSSPCPYMDSGVNKE